MSKIGYTQLPSGFWTKDSDASSPYIYDGNNQINAIEAEIESLKG